MNTNLVNFSDYKKKFDTQVIYLGDVVEWQDYTGEVYQATVKSISYLPFDGQPMTSLPKEFPLWEKADYAVKLDGGLEVSGFAILRKIIKNKTSGKKLNSSVTVN